LASEGGKQEGTPPLEATGFRYGDLRQATTIQAGPNVARSRHGCPVPPCGDAWRRLAKWFCGFGFAWPANAARRSFSVRAATVDNAIAAWRAATRRGSVRGAPPIAATSRVRRVGSIIATVSGVSSAPGAKDGRGARDGSGFPFDRFPAIIRMWEGGCQCPSGSAAIQRHCAAALAGKTAGRVAVLPDLWPQRAFRRPLSAHSTTKVSAPHDQS
jgi:hypothetical protein